MKTKDHRLQSCLLAALLLALPAVAQAQTYTNNYGIWNYTDNGDGTAIITEYTGSSGAVAIPTNINGLTVTTIGSDAFCDCPSLTSVTMGTNITSIGDYAFFECINLTSVTIGTNVTSIGGGAFNYCSSLTAITVAENNPAYSSLTGVLFDKSQTTLLVYPAGLVGSYTIPNSVTSIGDYYAFFFCTKLTSVTIGTNVTSIGDQAFYYCSGLTNLTIGTNVTSIGVQAFCGCTSLTSVTIPNSVTSLGDEAFWNCTSLTAITVAANNPAYSSLAGVLFDKNQTTLLEYPAGLVGNYTIPNRVTSIGDYSFSECINLTSVTIGTNVTSIGNYAFWYCDGLTNLTIGTNVTSIGDYAFDSCTSLTSVTIPNSITSIGDYAFAICFGLTSVTIGTNVTGIGDGAFEYCTNLTAITVAANNPAYSSLAGVLFDKNQTTLLEYPIGLVGSYTIPNSVTSIGDYAFTECINLTSVTIGTNVTSIGESAFYACFGLTNVTILNSITTIGDYAFCICDNLTRGYFEGNAPTSVGSDVFSGDNNLTIFYLAGTTGWSSSSMFGNIPLVEVSESNPTLAITSPFSGQNWSNAAFTVTGTASDNFQVSAVWSQVNSNGWQLATTANNWTNWTVTVSLIPGTNVLQGYAVNPFDFNSPTASVKLVYINSNALQVLTVGLGSISPNYSNTVLQIAQTYTMTATAGNGFVFTNWMVSTNWIGGMITNNATLQFTMAWDLTVMATFVDEQKPVLAITNVPAGLSVSNAAFTVKGTASDNWQVTNIFYSLNSGGWSNAVTANGWTNWSATVNLAPGTNTVQAYAVDPGGDVSLTTNVSLFFVVSNQLQIHAIGLGTISPNDSNVWLEIGRNYSITSTPANGFVFTNWLVSTDWIGGASVTGTNLQFMMALNLTLQVNFLDVTRPTLSITNLTTGQRVSNAVFTVKGTASDNWQVSNVVCQINGEGWNSAMNINNWTNWAAGVTLTPGTNIVQAFVVDTTGNVSTTNSVSFQFVVTNQLQIQASGLGTVSPNYSNAWLEIGRNYSITSTPASGFVFSNWLTSTNWIGGVTTTKTNLPFMMASNLTLQVTFLDVTKPTLSITAPTAGKHMTNAMATVVGTASDNWKVGAVWYQLTNGILTNGTWNLVTATTNNYTNWTTTVTLAAGSNTVKAYAVDLGGNHSTTSSVSVLSSNTFKLQLNFALNQPLTSTGLNFTLQLSSNLNGHIQVSTNLTSWNPLTNFVGTNTTLTFRDPAATNSKSRFYRATIP